MILSFIKKVSLIILITLSFQVFAENSYFHEDFMNSPFYEYVKNENRRILLITTENMNLKSSYRHPEFNNDFFSALYSDGTFVIYINKNKLSKKCTFAFQFYDLEFCESKKFTDFVKKFVNEEEYEFYEYEKEFNYFLFYHEFFHLLINEKWGFKYHSDIEFLADLMALDMLWMFHGIDYRKEVSVLREKNFYFKSDLQFKRYMKYKNYDLKNLNSDFNVNVWFSDILSFSNSSILKEDEKILMLDKVKSTNQLIIEKMKEFSKQYSMRDLEKFRKFFLMKLSTDQSLENLL